MVTYFHNRDMAITAACEPEAPPMWANLVARLTRRMPAGRYWLIHRLCHGRNRTFMGNMAGELGGFSFECCLRDSIAREVFFTGYYEPQESAFVRAALRPGMNFVDAGANWGFFTLMAAHLVGPLGKVVALEPDPRVFAKLKSNVERNHLDQVQILEVAAADNNSNLILAGHEEASDNWGISRLVESSNAASNVYTVRSRRLDAVLDEAGLGRVDLLKIDVEGAEDMVLAGMEAGLRNHRYRRILLELHPRQLAERGRTTEQVIGILKANGFKGYTLDHSPAVFRRACYHPELHFSEYIRPIERISQDAWPHTLWILHEEDVSAR
jgi:FkbM family methyltransferase